MRNFKTKHSDFCPKCRLYNDICMCAEIKEFTLNTRVTILMHYKERMKVSNTGKIAKLCLTNSKIVCKGEKDSLYSIDDLISSDYENILLYPSANAELNNELVKTFIKPINLIVLDGNYNQAGKMFRSETAFKDLKKVRLPYGQIRNCELRSTKYSEQISTIEAIINSLEIIKDSEANKDMDKIFREMMFRLKNRVQNIK